LVWGRLAGLPVLRLQGLNLLVRWRRLLLILPRRIEDLVMSHPVLVCPGRELDLFLSKALIFLLPCVLLQRLLLEVLVHFVFQILPLRPRRNHVLFRISSGAEGLLATLHLPRRLALILDVSVDNVLIRDCL
jgi:hypothetical protein